MGATDDSEKPRGGITTAVAVADPKLHRSVIAALQAAAMPVLDESCDVDDYEALIASVERLQPDVLFLGLPGLPADPALVIARLSALETAPRIIAVNDTAEPEMILKAMRSGAMEFVYPPLTSDAFSAALHRVVTDCGRAAPARPERATGLLIGFVSAKGGCGATTLACHSASHFRREAKRDVLLADMDMASGIAGAIMQAVPRYSLEDAVQNLHRLDLKLWKGLVTTAPSGVDVIPPPPDIPASTVPISRKFPTLLRFCRMHYDVTIVDLGSGTTQPLLDILDSLDTLVLVATNEMLALKLAKQMIQTLSARNLNSNRLKLVINRMPKHADIRLPELENIMGHAIYAGIANDSVSLKAAYSEPRLLDAGCELVAQIGAMADKLAGISGTKEKPRRFFGLRRKK